MDGSLQTCFDARAKASMDLGYVCICTHRYVCATVCAHIYIYVYTCIYIYVYTYIYMYSVCERYMCTCSMQACVDAHITMSAYISVDACLYAASGLALPEAPVNSMYVFHVQIESFENRFPLATASPQSFNLMRFSRRSSYVNRELLKHATVGCKQRLEILNSKGQPQKS